MIQKLKKNISNILSICLIFLILVLTEFVYKDSFIFPYMVFVLFWCVLCLIKNFEDVLSISLVLLIPEVITIETLPISVTVIVVLGTCISAIKQYLFEKKSIKKTLESNKTFLFLSILIILCGLINFDIKGIKYVFSLALFLAFIRFVLSQKLNIEKLKLYYVLGLLSIIAISVVLLNFNIIENRLVFQGSRLMSFCSNPNQLQIMCIIAMTLSFELLNKKIFCLLEFAVIYLFLLIIGFFTLSKAFFLCSTVLTLYIFIRLLLKIKKYKFLYVGMFSTVIALLGLVFKNNLSLLLKRFSNKYYDNIFDTLLTGRFSIWKVYLNEYASNIFNILFGCGLSAEEMVKIGRASCRERV